MPIEGSRFEICHRRAEVKSLQVMVRNVAEFRADTGGIVGRFRRERDRRHETAALAILVKHFLKRLPVDQEFMT